MVIMTMYKKYKLCLILIFLFLFLFQVTSCTTSNITKNSVEFVAQSSPLDGIWIGEFDIRGRGPYDFTAVHLQDRAYGQILRVRLK